MRTVALNDYFDVIGAKQSDRINFEGSKASNKHALPFVGRSSANNGVVDYVIPQDAYINKGDVITVALDGSTGSTFYQHHDFCSGQNIWLLIPKPEKVPRLDPLIALYLCTTIEKAVEAYSYNLSLTKNRLIKIHIQIPIDAEGKVDGDSIMKKMLSLRNVELLREIPLVRY